MSSEKKYIITRSNYTLKKKHKQLGNDSTIYERDFMVTNNGQTWSGDGSPYGTSSFKMVNNPKNGGSYKYNNGGWLKTPKCIDETHDYGDKWTLNCIPDKDSENSENNIHINPNNTSLLSFAYYGSTKDLIKNSINNIIENFPAEIIFTAYEDENGRFYWDTRRDKDDNKIRVKVYLKKNGTPLGDVWYFNFAQGKERVGYDTQKPIELLKRIILSSSNEGDIVADFFMGSGTTIFVAKELNRNYIGCDINPKSIEITNQRLK